MSHDELAEIFQKNVKVSPHEWKCDFYEIEIFYELKVYDQM